MTRRLKETRDSATPDWPGTRPRLGRHVILKGIAIAPALCTLLNGLCGFGSIHMATRSELYRADLRPGNEIWIAAWLIFLAMVFDMLDGRLARWARKTSDFGAQLDSLCDAISFGVAPAMLMLRAVVTGMRHESIGRLSFLPIMPPLEQVIWAVAAVYMACAVLRLARFNVENEPDESAHMSFRGLPSPGAAALVAALVLLFVHLCSFTEGPLANRYLLAAVCFLLPVATLAGALLMVSRVRYPHIVNQYIRGKKPFSYILKLLALVLVAYLEPYLTAAVVCLLFTLMGPIGALRRKMHPTTATPPGQSPPTV
jgi:CDP-diacylglycerol---serine O-phosphatidyltransferase